MIKGLNTIFHYACLLCFLNYPFSVTKKKKFLLRVYFFFIICFHNCFFSLCRGIAIVLLFFFFLAKGIPRQINGLLPPLNFFQSSFSSLRQAGIIQHFLHLIQTYFSAIYILHITLLGFFSINELLFTQPRLEK